MKIAVIQNLVPGGQVSTGFLLRPGYYHSEELPPNSLAKCRIMFLRVTIPI